MALSIILTALLVMPLLSVSYTGDEVSSEKITMSSMDWDSDSTDKLLHTTSSGDQPGALIVEQSFRSVVHDSEGNTAFTGVIGKNSSINDQNFSVSGGRDILVSKFNMTTSSLDWAIQVGSPIYNSNDDHDYGRTIEVDSNDSFIVAGTFGNNTNFSTGNEQTFSQHSRGAFVGKISNDGQWLWTKTINAVISGGTTNWFHYTNIQIERSTIDGNDDVTFYGHFHSNYGGQGYVHVMFDSINLSSTVSRQGWPTGGEFIAQMNSTTGAWNWAQLITCQSCTSDLFLGLETAPDDSIIISGDSRGNSLDFCGHALHSLFLCKLESNGSPRWVQYNFSYSSGGGGAPLAVNSYGEILVKAGWAGSSNGGYQMSLISPDGMSFIWNRSTYTYSGSSCGVEYVAIESLANDGFLLSGTLWGTCVIGGVTASSEPCGNNWCRSVIISRVNRAGNMSAPTLFDGGRNYSFVWGASVFGDNISIVGETYCLGYGCTIEFGSTIFTPTWHWSPPYLQAEISFLWTDIDTDSDSVFDSVDRCPYSQNQSISNAWTDHDYDGCHDLVEDDDDDDDTVLDIYDDCPLGDVDWTQNSTTDHDYDGCQDSNEDTDDDNDGISDSEDYCPTGELNWTSDSSNDYDSDGCRDSTEDTDDDNDGISDVGDSCQTGDMNWTSNGAATATITITDFMELNTGDKVNLVATDGTNYDFTNGDQSSVNGTWESTISNNQTATNLMNVINTSSGLSGTRFTATVDGAVVTATQAIAGVGGNTNVTLTDSGTAGMTKTDFTIRSDYDYDGCRDSTEDTDDDNDGAPDYLDDCPLGDVDWTQNSTTDHDYDGCQDSNEDTDDDNDGISDSEDYCPTGELNWTSDSSNDHDYDGCQDSNEDTDDDNDGVPDSADDCRRGFMNWISDSNSDHDSDGCRDATSEDEDDDNDGVPDSADDCWTGEMFWTSNSVTDHDSDGCRDSTEDEDDDNDGFSDYDEVVNCGESNSPIDQIDHPSDYDKDGICDGRDHDDDNDGVPDSADDCRRGFMNWISDSNSDHDSDGCRDSTEDEDDDNDGVPDSADDCQTGETLWFADSNSDHDSDGCRDSTEDEDDDNDGYSDLDETTNCDGGAYASTSLPLDETSTPADMDGDMICDALDRNRDGDGYSNTVDAFPDDPSEWFDTDGDGFGNNVDPDDDGDEYSDANDWDPLDPLEWMDADGDGFGDNGDMDDDNDGYPDSVERDCGSFPKDKNSLPEDMDNDGLCDLLDLDMDGDGYNNTLEVNCDTDPTVSSNIPSDYDSDGVCDYADRDKDGDGFSDIIEMLFMEDPMSSEEFPTFKSIPAIIAILALISYLAYANRFGISEGYLEYVRLNSPPSKEMLGEKNTDSQLEWLVSRDRVWTMNRTSQKLFGNIWEPNPCVIAPDRRMIGVLDRDGKEYLIRYGILWFRTVNGTWSPKGFLRA